MAVREDHARNRPTGLERMPGETSLSQCGAMLCIGRAVLGQLRASQANLCKKRRLTPVVVLPPATCIRTADKRVRAMDTRLRESAMNVGKIGKLSTVALAGVMVAGVALFGEARGQDTGMGGMGSAYCATTPDPAACQQLLSSAISQGLISGSGGSGLGGLSGLAGSAQVNGVEAGPPPSVTVTPVPPASKRVAEHSHLEDIYSQRAGSALQQFGYDVLGNGGTISALQVGAIQDDYILGQGDAIVVTLRGQENATYDVFVDRDGNVTLPKLRPVSASGRHFGEFRDELMAAIRQGYLQTKAYVTMGQVRQISVNVVGEVTNPGVYALSGLSSVLDALNVAGGIRKGGSLRRVLVERAGRSVSVDLYRYLSPSGAMPDVSLRQGDRIVVAPLGATVAVAGDVRRQGIYELPAGARGASANTVLALANGYAIRGRYRLNLLRTRPDGKQQFEDISAHPGTEVRDGEIIIVNAAANVSEGSVELAGNVRLPGKYALNRVRNLHELLPGAETLLPMTYLPFGFILRKDQQTLRQSVIPFSVEDVLSGKYNEPLRSQDVVHVLSFDAMRELAGLAAPQILLPASQQACTPQPQGSLVSLLAANNASAVKPDEKTVMAQLESLRGANAASIAATAQSSSTPCPPGTTPGTAPAATVAGPLSLASQPGVYPGSVPGTVNGMVPGAPGAIPGATSAISAPAGTEAAAAIATLPGEAPSAIEGLSLNEAATVGFVVSDYRVTLEGAVRVPGDYLAVPGIGLDEVINAANGLAPDADLNAIEITSVVIDNVGGSSTTSRKLYALNPQTLGSVSLSRLDVVHVPAVPTNQQEGVAQVLGEVKFPGTFHLLRGERLSSILERAGGFTVQAYPTGAVFLRPSVAKVRADAYRREADDLQKQLMASVAQGGNALAQATATSGGLSAEAAAFVEDVINQLRTKPTDGRMSVIADPAALAANPDRDIEMQPGDTLVIPKRPSEVDVTGEVLNPGSFRYSAKLDVSDYIDLSGGYDRYADEDHIFIINPDGTARQVSGDLFDFRSTALSPGSVVVVPRDLRPLDLGVLSVTLAKILSDVAISGASLAVISRNN